MPRHGAAVLRPAAGALATLLPAGLLAWSLAACADGPGTPTAPARPGAGGAPAAVAAGDLGVDPIASLLFETFFARESDKILANVHAAYATLSILKPGDQDCADALFLANLTLDRLASNTLGPTPGTFDPQTPARVNTLLAWLAPTCADVPASLPAGALGPNGLAVAVDASSAYTLTTRDGVLRLELPAHTFDRNVLLVVTRVAAGPGGGPFATTLPQYTPMFRLTTFPAANRTPAGTIDFAVANVGNRAPPKAAVGQLMPIFGQTSPAAGTWIAATIGRASQYYNGSPGYMRGPDGLVNPKPFIGDSTTTSGTSSGSIPTIETTCDLSDDCSLYRYASLRGLPATGTRAPAAPSGPRFALASAAAAGSPPAPAFDLTVGLTRIYDPAINGRAMLSATHVCGLRYTVTNAGSMDLVAVVQPVDRNGASVGGMWRTPVLVPAKGSRAVRIALPPGVSPSTVAAFHLMYGPTLVKAVRPGTNACP